MLCEFDGLHIGSRHHYKVSHKRLARSLLLWEFLLYLKQHLFHKHSLADLLPMSSHFRSDNADRYALRQVGQPIFGSLSSPSTSHTQV